MRRGASSRGLPPARSRPPGLLAAILLLGIVSSGCGQPAPEGANVLLVSIDTLRASHLGCYGHPRATSPVLDRFAEGAVLFERAYAPTPWTLPSHAGMLTGTHPYDLGMRHKKSAIPPGAPTLGQLASRAGYRTAAFVDSSPGGYVGAERGFARGFGEYHHAPHEKGLHFRYDMAVTADAALGWLRENAGKGSPFFLFVHTKSVHAVPPKTECLDERCFPYEKPEPYRFRFVDPARADFHWKEEGKGYGQEYLWSLNRAFLAGRLDPRSFPAERLEVLRGLYDAGIAYTDEHLGRLLEGLDELGVGDNTLVIVTSDHGEAFLDHNLLMHQEVYEEALHVPLLVRPPGPQRPGRRVAEPVSLTDLVPTVAALAGFPTPATVTGRPLPLEDLEAGGREAGNPAASPREIFGYYLFPPNFTYRAFALRGAEHTLVVHNFADPAETTTEVYAAADLGQRTPLDVAEEGAEGLARGLLGRLRQRLASEPLFEPELVEEDPEALEQLKSVGYID